jgi:hypothetical protein
LQAWRVRTSHTECKLKIEIKAGLEKSAGFLGKREENKRKD